jgi:hypothetical protein
MAAARPLPLPVVPTPLPILTAASGAADSWRSAAARRLPPSCLPSRHRPAALDLAPSDAETTRPPVHRPLSVQGASPPRVHTPSSVPISGTLAFFSTEHTRSLVHRPSFVPTSGKEAFFPPHRCDVGLRQYREIPDHEHAGFPLEMQKNPPPPNKAVQLTPLARRGTWARLFRQSAAACGSLRQRPASSIRHVVCHGRFTSRRRRLAHCLLPYCAHGPFALDARQRRS